MTFWQPTYFLKQGCSEVPSTLKKKVDGTMLEERTTRPKKIDMSGTLQLAARKGKQQSEVEQCEEESTDQNDTRCPSDEDISVSAAVSSTDQTDVSSKNLDGDIEMDTAKLEAQLTADTDQSVESVLSWKKRILFGTLFCVVIVIVAIATILLLLSTGSEPSECDTCYSSIGVDETNNSNPTSHPSESHTSYSGESHTNYPTEVDTNDPSYIEQDTNMASAVREEDTLFVAPSSYGPVITPITGYNWRKDRTDRWYENPTRDFEWPMIKRSIMDRETDEFWDNLVEELLFGRIGVVSLHGRGAWYPEDESRIGLGTGDMDPRMLTRFIDAVDRVGDNARETLKLTMWDDTGMYPGAHEHVFGKRINMRNWKTTADFMFDYNIKLWHDTIPRDMWFTIDDRPVIAEWTFKPVMDNPGNVNGEMILEEICDLFNQRYHVVPYIILHDKWFSEYQLVRGVDCVVGEHNWISPKENILHSYTAYNGFVTGVLAPGFVYPHNSDRRDVSRDNGERLVESLTAGMEAEADFVMLEGWTNFIEGAGLYRSNEWQYPSQYISTVRRFADPDPVTLRFQGEAADEYYDTSEENISGDYCVSRGIDVKRFKDGGWYVDNTEAGEWLTFKEIHFGGGRYRWTIRVATNVDGAQVRLDLPGMLTVTLPNTDGNFTLVHLGESILPEYTPDVTLEIKSSGIQIDWIHMRKQ